MAHLQEGCPNYTQRDNLNNTFEVDKFKVQKQKTINSYKKLIEVHLLIRLYPSKPQTAHLNLVRQFL
jgi:hypothetical protein